MAPNLEAQVDLAHLLRTPLTSIKGYTSSLLRSDMTWPPELQREFLQTIEQATDQLNQTVSDLLTPTRSVPDEIQLLRSEITIQRLLEQAKADLDGENWPAPLHLGWNPDLPPVLVDHQRVRQVISHLIRCVGDPVAPVYLAARHQDGQPTIIIEPVDSNHLSNGPWQKFLGEGDQVTEHHPGAPGDRELRMVMCRAILQAHGATLRWEISPGEMARFGFGLPVAPQRN